MMLMTLMSLFVAAAIGCNEHGGGRELHESNLRLIAVLYSQYSSAHEGEAPRDAEDFRAYVQSLGPGVLERAGLSEMDELFVSTRDGKLFAVKYKRRNLAARGRDRIRASRCRRHAVCCGRHGRRDRDSEAEFLSRLKQ